MSRWLREHAPRGASDKNFGTGALYSGELALSTSILSTNVFTGLKNNELAQRHATQQKCG